MATNGVKTNGVNGHAAPLEFTTFYNTLNGKSVSTKETRRSINPSTLEENPEVPVATKEDVDAAVEYATAAGEKWAEVPVEERQAAVIKFADALASYKDEFATLLTKEQGKPYAFAAGEVDNGVLWLKAQAAIPFPEEVVEESDERLVVTRYTALGVAVAIVPWNFPIQLACGKIAPALIAGNTLILKPSPFTPYCGLKLCELAQQFFPPGVFQALSGDDSLGPWLTAHPGVDKVSFTGSTATGKRVMESCSATLKRVTLELGGKDPAIICADVDIAATAPKIAQLALLNSGQICVAIKRIYIHASIFDEFLAAMVEAVKGLAIGDGFKEGVFMGPIQNKMQFERVKGFFKDVKEEKLEIATGGDLESVSSAGKGYFVTPTIINNPPDNSRIVVEEPFGPIFPVLKWESEDEVVKRANNTLMGLGASVWTRDLEQASRLGKKMKAGNVWVNSHLELQPDLAFGGHKQSGLGAEWGLQGLKSYCNSQVLYLKKK